ncbi:MAG: hypothetical protein ACRDSZ_09410 [Pseudonocardiaceae bacterium]
MSDTQIIIALVAGASVVIIFCCLILVVVVRLHRAVKSQLETIDKVLGAPRAGRGRDTTREPSEPPGTGEG